MKFIKLLKEAIDDQKFKQLNDRFSKIYEEIVIYYPNLEDTFISIGNYFNKIYELNGFKDDMEKYDELNDMVIEMENLLNKIKKAPQFRDTIEKRLYDFFNTQERILKADYEELKAQTKSSQ